MSNDTGFVAELCLDGRVRLLTSGEGNSIKHAHGLQLTNCGPRKATILAAGGQYLVRLALAGVNPTVLWFADLATELAGYSHRMLSLFHRRSNDHNAPQAIAMIALEQRPTCPGATTT